MFVYLLVGLRHSGRIAVIYAAEHRCASGLKKKFDLSSDSDAMEIRRVLKCARQGTDIGPLF